MSYIHEDSLTDFELVARYILDRRNKGLFLRRSEHQIIKQWLDCGADAETLLISIEQVMAEDGKTITPALESIYSKVCKKITLSRLAKNA